MVDPSSHNVFVSLSDSSEESYNNSNNNNEHKLCSLQTGVALLFAAFTMILNFLVIAIIHERVPNQPPLPDISFDLLPEAAWGLSVAEYTISILAFIVFILLFMHRHRVILLRRLCLIMGIIYLARAICMASTQVPLIKTDYCAPKMTPEQYQSWSYYLSEISYRVFHMMLGFGLSINGRHVYCGDYIFSGHTVTLTFCKYINSSLELFTHSLSIHSLSYYVNNVITNTMSSCSLFFSERIHDAKNNKSLHTVDIVSCNNISKLIFRCDTHPNRKRTLPHRCLDCLFHHYDSFL